MTGLERRLGTADATWIGVGSMVGAGVFAAFGPAAEAAGSGLLVGLAIAALVAYCNATASAQLAAQYPVSGGSYVYGRERLGHWWGFTAGWCFVTGKTASCAAMAVTVGAYLLPDSAWGQRVVGIAAVVALTLVAVRGVTRTAQLTRVLVAASIAVLAVSVGLLVAGDVDADRLTLSDISGYGILQSAGLLFFAFAGYARIATMGEEVRDPTVTTPRAIVLALGIALMVYLAVGVAALTAVGAEVLAGSDAPLSAALEVVGAGWFQPILAGGAVVASLGALLALLNGIGRTGLAMGRHRDLPGRLAEVSDDVPRNAQLVVGAVVCVLVATVDLRGIIGFSSFGVLLYYAVANLAAWTQDSPHRRWSRAWQAVGLLGCGTLVVTLPIESVLTGVAVLVVGLGGRAVLRSRHRG